MFNVSGMYDGVSNRKFKIEQYLLFKIGDRLVGLVVKASASRAGGPGFESRLRRDFFGVESYQ